MKNFKPFRLYPLFPSAHRTMAQDFLGLLRVTQTAYSLEVLVEG